MVSDGDEMAAIGLVRLVYDLRSVCSDVEQAAPISNDQGVFQ